MREIYLTDLEESMRSGATLVEVREARELAEWHVVAAAGYETRSVGGGTAAWIRAGRPVEAGVR